VNDSAKRVASTAALVAASSHPGVRRIVVSGVIKGAPTLRLAPGQQLIGETEGAGVLFAPGVDGVQLSSDNEVRNLRIETLPGRRAIFNDTGIDILGLIALANVTAVGQVQILLRDRLRRGHVSVKGLNIIDADARGRRDRPSGYGAELLQGAFTLWNLQLDDASMVTAELVGITVGEDGAPVRGSGVCIGGAPVNGGGRLRVSRLETGPVFCDGKIAPATANLITGGVFVLHGAHVDEMRNRGPVTTFGVNDMVLGNWGDVERWIAEAKLVSHGAGATGLVNAGTIRELKVEGPIETFGLGARGFEVCAGNIDSAEFDRIITHADAAIGVQISGPLGRLIVRRGLETRGGMGTALLEGVIARLAAAALSIKRGGSIGAVLIEGGIVTKGDGAAAIEIEQGMIGPLRVKRAIETFGKSSDAIRVVDGVLPLDGLRILAEDGIAVRLQDARLAALRNTTARGSAGDVVVEGASTLNAEAGSVAELATGFGNAFTISGSGRLELRR
jgi:hypothetical protein